MWCYGGKLEVGLLRVGRGGVYDRMRAGSSAWAGWSGGCADVVGSVEVRDAGVCVIS